LSNDSISDSDFDTMDPRSLAATVARARLDPLCNQIKAGAIKEVSVNFKGP